MRYFSLLILFFMPAYSWAIDYHLENKTDKNNHIDYYTLSVIDGNKKTVVGNLFEGNAFQAKIEKIFTLSCPWGVAEGLNVSSSTSSIETSLTINDFYFFDKHLTNIFAKRYIQTTQPENKMNFYPISLKYAVCERIGKGVIKDTISGQFAIFDYEVISHGPFLLKEVPDTYVKYVIDDNANINFIYEHEYGENLIDSYGKKNNSVAKIASVFFTPLANQNHIINLVYWLAEDDNRCYQVYAYRYDQQGNFSANPNINNDPNLSGCDKGKQKFNYNTASAIKAYLKQKYSEK